MPDELHWNFNHCLINKDGNRIEITCVGFDSEPLGLKWNDPLGFTRNRRSYLSFQYNQFFIDEPTTIMETLGDEGVYNIALGLRF